MAQSKPGQAGIFTDHVVHFSEVSSLVQTFLFPGAPTISRGLVILVTKKCAQEILALLERYLGKCQRHICGSLWLTEV